MSNRKKETIMQCNNDPLSTTELGIGSLSAGAIRKSADKELNAPVTVYHQGHSFSGILLKLNQGQMILESHKYLPVGEEICLELGIGEDSIGYCYVCKVTGVDKYSGIFNRLQLELSAKVPVHRSYVRTGANS